MTDWAALRHAYGTAEDVPDLLRAAEESSTEVGDAWDDLWSRLCHQDTVYTASYEDGGVWQRQLSHVADGELPVVCPHCRRLLLLDLDAGEVTLGDGDGSARPTPVQPGDPAEGSVGARMVDLCHRSGRPGVAARLRYALGRASCPVCRAVFDVPDALT